MGKYQKEIGIYKIENLINRKVYIGSSIDIQRRLKQHLNDLKHNKHYNKSLQEDWNLYGNEHFEFKTIEICIKEELDDLEKHCVNKYAMESRYNIAKPFTPLSRVARAKLYCEVCGCSENDTPNMYGMRNKFKMVLCSKHFDQMRVYGQIITRTIYDANEYILYEDYAEICLYDKNGNEVARTKIDLEDVEKCKEHKWCLCKGYVSAGNRSYSLHLHRFVMNATVPEILVDHIFHDKLDNRKSQLRIATKQQNQMNRKPHPHNKSGCAGVRFHKKKWEASITLSGKFKYLGMFSNKEDAISARKQAEEKYFGDFAYKDQTS